MNKSIDPQERHCSRREFLSTALAAPILATEFSSSFQPRNLRVASPDGNVRFEILLREHARLSYRVTFGNRVVIEDSPLGIVIDGVDLCRGVVAGKIER
jgi:Glycosyl-hydrolase 97 N-terminal